MSHQILVADDSQAIHKIVELAFLPYDVTLFTAENWEHTCRLTRQHDLDLVIMDACLPGLSSPQLMAQLSPTAAPVLLIEGAFEDVDHSQFTACGFPHFLRKPFDTQRLLALLREKFRLNFVPAGAAAGLRTPTQNTAATTSPLNPNLEPMVLQWIEAYCRREFEVIATKVIKAEIEKLAQTRQELMIDNPR